MQLPCWAFGSCHKLTINQQQLSLELYSRCICTWHNTPHVQTLVKKIEHQVRNISVKELDKKMRGLGRFISAAFVDSQPLKLIIERLGGIVEQWWRNQ